MVNYEKGIKGGEKMSTMVKLKGVSFFRAGSKGKETIRELDGLVIRGELEDGRPTTQCIPWDSLIEVNAPGTFIATTMKK